MSKYQIINGWTQAKMIEAIETKNNGKASIENGECVYLSKDGNRCAIGCFIDFDKFYEVSNKYNSGTSVGELCLNITELKESLPLSVLGLEFLQIVHDSCEEFSDPRPHLKQWILANTYE